MKFQKVGLISAAAVLATMVSAGAYTQPAPHIPTPVGNSDGAAFYIGGAISTLGGYARNQSYTTGSASTYSYTVATSPFAISGGTTLNSSSLSTVAADYTSTVSTLKFGGEAHLGAYFGVAEGFGLGIEAFGVTRTSFNPISTVTFTDAVSSSSLTSLTTTQPAAAGSDPNANSVTVGLNIQPKSLGYGVRFQPTVMLGDTFGIYASVGYGSQEWEGTLNNSEFFYKNNLYTAYVPATSTQSGTTNVSGQAISQNLSGVNYGLGSVYNIDETISVYTSLEVQKFESFSINSAGDEVGSTTYIVPANGTAAGTYYAGNTSIVDAGTTATPSAVSLQLNTYSVGIDYAFA